jgi:protein-S-isoprenylcysteine O-methyltransferase
MLRRTLSSFAVCSLVFLGPLLAMPAALANPAPWLGMLFAMVTLLSQPKVDFRESASHSARDRGSALAIFVTMIAAQTAAVLEFALRQPAAPGPGIVVAGAFLAITGLTMRLWAIRTLGRFFTSTVRVANDHQVVQSGPYRRLRHPSYAGALLAALGITVALGSRLGFGLILILCVPAYLYRIAVEERALVAELGTSYSEYRARTWGLIPGVQ